ncbi:hypothetical protein BBJ28_00017339 [Nothophytophthora sp. Chile5]|nr:hypothetical protein BBJ28_00017339 [Nothophytophthora sp. Chile5]
MVASLKLSTVVHGSHRDQHHLPEFSIEEHYKFAQEADIFKLITSPSSLDVNDIVARINDNRERFEKKFESKMKSEEEYYADRYGKTKKNGETAARSLALLSLSTFAVIATSCASKFTMESADAVKAEELYNDNAFDRRELLAKLRDMHAAHPEDVAVIWRLTRAAYDVANLKATSADEKKELTYYARDVIQKGLDLTKDVAAVHNW